VDAGPVAGPMKLRDVHGSLFFGVNVNVSPLVDHR
jgi:hypothetical protein